MKRPRLRLKIRRPRFTRGNGSAGAALALSIAAAAVGFNGPVPTCNIANDIEDTTCTPGALNADVTQSNVGATICRSGFTSTIRPPVSYTNPLKRELMRWYHLTGDPAGFELDHLVSLELGGDPRDPRNLWPQPYAPKPGAREKDHVENYLHDQVCSGGMTLEHAQELIRTDWTVVYKQITK